MTLQHLILLPDFRTNCNDMAPRQHDDSSIEAATVAAAQAAIDIMRAETLQDDGITDNSLALKYITATHVALNNIMAPALTTTAAAESVPSISADQLLHISPFDGPSLEDIVRAITEETSTPPISSVTINSLNGPSIAKESDCTSLLLDSLNNKQRDALLQCTHFFQEFQQFKDGHSRAAKSLRLLIHSGPGTGKSYLTRSLVQTAESRGLTVLCMAPTGIAAGNMPNGRTIHSSLSIPCMAKGNAWLPLPKLQQLAKMQSRVNTSTLCMVVIDEISYMGPIIFGQVEARLRSLMASNDTFGGLGIILMGDFFQLPPVVPSETLYMAVMKQQVDGISLDPVGAVGSPRSVGTSLFASFTRIELTEQMRASRDIQHTEMLDRMRSPPLGQNRITVADLARLRVLTPEDVREDPRWANTHIVVTSNAERININDWQSANFAAISRQPRLIWNLPLLGPAAAMLPHDDLVTAYKNNNELLGIFVTGAKAFMTENLNPTRGLANGTAVVYHSINLHESEDRERIIDEISSASGKDIYLLHPPTSINVSIINANPAEFIGRTVVANEVVIPIHEGRKPTEHKVMIHGKKLSMTTRSIATELGYAVTIHKVQGQTCDRLAIDINLRPFLPHISFHGLYVALSRVRESSNLRIMPLQPNIQNLNHLLKLEPPEDLLAWLDGFDSNGVWIASNSKLNRKTAKAKKSLSHNTYNVHTDPTSTMSNKCIRTPPTCSKVTNAAPECRTIHRSVDSVTSNPKGYEYESILVKSCQKGSNLVMNVGYAPVSQTYIPSVHELISCQEEVVTRSITAKDFMLYNRLKLVLARSDGHCMMIAWSIATGSSMENIHQMIVDEYLLNRLEYAAHSVNEDDLYRYLASKDFQLQSVDNIINILCNSTNTTAVVIEEREQEPITNFMMIRPRSRQSQQTVLLMRKNDHYDAII